MEIQPIWIDHIQICTKCERKLHKGEMALKVSDMEIYFCDTNCLIKTAEVLIQ